MKIDYPLLMRAIKSYMCIILLLGSFLKGIAFQKKSISKSEEEFILNEKDSDTVQSFLAQRISNDLELAEISFNLYLDRGIKEKNDTIQIWANYYLSFINYQNKDYDIAIQYADKSVELAEKLNNGNYIISGLSILGGAYQKKRDRKNALKQYLAMKEIIKKYDLKQYEIDNLVSIGQIRIRLDQNKKALTSLNKGLELLQKPAYKSQNNYNSKYLSTLQGIGVCYYKMNNYDEALNYGYKGLQYAEKHNLKDYIIDFNLNIGEAYIGKKKYIKALSYLNISKSDILILNKENDPDLFIANLHIATCFYALSKYNEARDLLIENFSQIENNPEVEKIQEAYTLAIKCGEKLNDTDLQFKYTKVYNKIVDSIYQNEINAQGKLYNHDIENLEKKNLDLVSKNNLYIIGFLVALIVAIAAFIYNIKAKRKNKFLFNELQKEKIQEINSETVAIAVSKNEYITDKKAENLLQKLSLLEKSEFYVSTDCNLYNTAKSIGTNTTYLSKVINEYQKQSFNDYINKLRIRYFRYKFHNDAKFRSYTIKAIAGELGYGSVNTFTSAFKKETGLSHSYYIKKITAEMNVSKQQDKV